ncbi:sensor histidine kinase [Paenibacillus sp. FSL K6-3182]|uniref:cache domain-containing sensor histidine kinase n=1 Tax=unclassified Paenibacillus TaxID=185978 RepID=UPI0030CF7AA6
MIRKAALKLKKQGLFLKLFLVTLISIVTVSLITLAITISMSEKLFFQTFSITNSKLLNQMKTNLESYNYTVATGAAMIAQNASIRNYLSGEETDAVSLATETYHMTEGMKAIRSNFSAYDVGIMIIGVNGRSYSTDAYYWSTFAEEMKNHTVTKATNDQSAQILYQLYPAGDNKGIAKEQVLVASKALFDQQTSSFYGTLYVAIRDRNFRSFYANFTSEGNDVLLINKNGLIVSSNRSERIGLMDKPLYTEVAAQQLGEEDEGSAYVMGNERIVFSEYLPEFDFYLVNLIDKKAVTGQMVNAEAVTLTIMVIVAISLIIVFLITRKMTKSLRVLVKQMSHIPTSGFDNHIDIATSSYEVKELGNAFNYMLDALHDYVDRLLETQKQVRNAELAALQMQINPHFLYNTLASIKFLVLQGNKEKAAGTINALISLLQNTVSDVESTIPVCQELETMKHYVYINHVRYSEKIRVNYFVEPDSLDYHIPKLILQPFIENAFFHGFNIKEQGSILIMIAVQEDQLVCEVVDNGDGMDIEQKQLKVEKIRTPKRKRQFFSGIGIRNVDDRIKLMYGENYGINITSKRGEGTKIKINIPLINK